MLARAFADDPMMRWVIGDVADPVARIADYFRFIDEDFARLGMLWECGDAEGAAVWIPPDHAGLAEVDAATRPKVHAITDDGGLRHDAFWDWIESRIPDEPMWYLDQIASDPACRGRGVGSALLAFGLEEARATSTPAFLETGNPRNLGLYERFGFRVVEDEDAPGGGPHIWFMRSDPPSASRLG